MCYGLRRWAVHTIERARASRSIYLEVRRLLGAWRLLLLLDHVVGVYLSAMNPSRSNHKDSTPTRRREREMRAREQQQTNEEK